MTTMHIKWSFNPVDNDHTVYMQLPKIMVSEEGPVNYVEKDKTSWEKPPEIMKSYMFLLI